MNWNKISIKNSELKHKKNSVIIKNLFPDTQYEFQLGACNLRGCTYSAYINGIYLII